MWWMMIRYSCKRSQVTYVQVEELNDSVFCIVCKKEEELSFLATYCLQFLMLRRQGGNLLAKL